MAIIFNSEKALNQLLDSGIVYTFRAKPRKVIGRDWATDRRGGRKLADVSLVGCLFMENLSPSGEKVRGMLVSIHRVER